MNANGDRIQRATHRGTLPYWYSDNLKFIDGTKKIVDKTTKEYPKAWREKQLAIANVRHQSRTEKQIEDIQIKWDSRTICNTIDKIDNNIVDENEKWFRNEKAIGYARNKAGERYVKTVGKYVEIKIETNKHNNGSTDMRGVINMQKAKIKECASAIRKIKINKVSDITMNEADSMATLWLEINHNRHKIPEGVAWEEMTYIERSAMEMMNEFVSRKTLSEFYRNLGAIDTPWKSFEFTRESTGYNSMVRAYDYLIDKFNLNRGEVLKLARVGLFNGNYCKQEMNAVNALMEAGLKDFKRLDKKNIGKSQVNELVKYCRKARYMVGNEIIEKIDNYLITNKILK